MLKINKTTILFFLFYGKLLTSFSQTPLPVGDKDATLHLMQPLYPIPYGKTTIQDIKTTLDRVYNYLDATTPMVLIDSKTMDEVVDYSKINKETIFKRGDFRLISYEWGVTYSGMLHVGEVTGDPKYTKYTTDRLDFLAKIEPYFKSQTDVSSKQNPMRAFLAPHALDDVGAICAAMIKSKPAGVGTNLRPIIDNFIDYISSKEYRLPDGTLARNRPLPNTIWLDDLFMSVPALAQMGKLTGETTYFDDAVKQVLQFSQRMFVKENGLYRHGWVQGMEPHPSFHWARANGWAFMTMAELLDVLPESHPGYQAVLEQFRALAKGLASYQSGTGFWHQLLDRNDSYLETSATAIYTYAYAKGINRGWLDKKAYGPMTLLAWNAIASKVNDKGQVEGTCVGTGMGFDPAFYCYRPINIYAAHGYGPVLLAGSEMIQFINSSPYTTNDSAVMFGDEK